ncbi:MAG: ATP-binding protein [Planctomycetota bacterium]
MPPAKQPNNELDRIAALSSCQLLDTPADPAFDDLTALVSELLGCPIAAVSLVDESRQWFKSRVGLDVPQTHRDVAFCAHAILLKEPLIVMDAASDPLTFDNPLVTGEPGIRFYAGHPLILDDGHAVGTLCVIDTKPRRIDRKQLSVLRRLAGQATQLLQYARQNAVVSRKSAELEALRFAMDKHTLFSITDRAGRIVDVNEGFCNISGYQRDELIGQDHRMLNSGHHPKAFWKQMWQTIRSGKDWREDVCNKAKDGSLYWVDSTNIPKFDEDGKVIGFISLRFDITEQKRASDKIVLAKQQAEAANKAKSDFLANMSHEIRTPMSAILGYTDLLAEDGDLSLTPERRLQTITTIQSNANHLLNIIDDILDVSKIEAGQLRLESIETDPVQIANEVVSLLRAPARDKGIGLAVRYETPIPRRIQSDPTRLRQVLLNLTGNAVKFTELGGVTIHIACEPEQQRLTFGVTDTGIGMTPQQLETISQCKAFTQADETMTRKFGGTGLGLRISNALAGMLGGGIKIESELAKGSTFTVSIQTGDLSQATLLKPDQLNAKPITPHPEQTGKQQSDPQAKTLEGVRILLAEDGLDNQRLLKHYLTKAGAQVTVCENGLHAVQAIEAASGDEMPHLILMDMQMPELDGYGATGRLRSLGYTLPIIAVTAHAMDGDREKCIDAGCDDYLTKPIDKALLIRLCGDFASKRAGKRKRDAA